MKMSVFEDICLREFRFFGIFGLEEKLFDKILLPGNFSLLEQLSTRITSVGPWKWRATECFKPRELSGFGNALRFPFVLSSLVGLILISKASPFLRSTGMLSSLSLSVFETTHTTCKILNNQSQSLANLICLWEYCCLELLSLEKIDLCECCS